MADAIVVFRAVITDRSRGPAPDANRQGPFITRDLFVSVLVDDDDPKDDGSLTAFYMAHAATKDGMVLALDLIDAVL